MSAREKWLADYRAYRAEEALWLHYMDRLRGCVEGVPSWFSGRVFMTALRLSGDELGWCASLGPKAMHKVRMGHLKSLRPRLPA